MAINPKIRWYVQHLLQESGSVPLSPEQAHHALSVMRLREGEAVALFNGRDGEWAASFHPTGKKHAECRVTHRLRSQVGVPDIWYVFAPIKHGRIDFIAQKATELGASALVPAITRRTIVSRVNEDRLLANAIEAAEQSGRLDVPCVEQAQSLEKLLSAWPQGRLLVYGDESGRGKPPKDLFSTLSDHGKWAVLIGPEGGFTTEEFAMLRAMKQARAISLGPRVLRADTAGLAALACLQAWCGDWHLTPNFEG